MQGTELFLSLAEIAGVFVGFGALIAVRSGATMSVGEISGIRWVLMEGIWVVIVAIVPILVSQYGVVGHDLWLICSLLAFALHLVMLAVYARTPENLADRADTLASMSPAKVALVMVPIFWLPTAALLIALVLVMLGFVPDQEQALYLTAAGLGLFMGALALFAISLWQPVPSAARGPRDPGAPDASVGASKG